MSLAVLLFLVIASADEADALPADLPRSAAAAVTPPVATSTATLGDLAWMAGHWTSPPQAHPASEELWLPPRGGIMVGVNRTMTSADQASFEYLRIEQRPGGVVYVASPGGAPPTEFRLTQASATSATFENPEHDFPKRLVYRREGDALVARVDAGSAAPEHGFELRWTLQPR